MATVTKPLALNESLNSTENTPRNVADILAEELDGIKQAINGQSGSGSGHIIQNSSGANMPSENTMQFTDAHLSDDSVGGKTKVETFKAVTEAEYASETEDGAYIITDGDGATIGEASEDYVLAEKDGTKTWQQLLNSIWSDADKDKITDNAYIYIHGTILSIVYKSSGQCIFSLADVSSQVPASSRIKLASTCTFEQYSSATYRNLTSEIATEDVYLYYGNKKAIVDLQTTANRCLYDSNTTVKEKIDETNAERMSTSILTYAASLNDGFYLKQTASGTTDNPTSASSYLHLIYRYSTGITILAIRNASREMYINASANSGSTWSGWSTVI